MTLILSVNKDNKQLELEKRNTLILSIAQGLSVTTTNINMINTARIKKNYYFLESNSGAMKEHIKSSALYDMIETN